MADVSELSEAVTPREIDYELLRPLSRASFLRDISVMRFSAHATRPLIGTHPGTLHQELSFKGHLCGYNSGNVLAMVSFRFAAAPVGAEDVCVVEGDLMVFYELRPDDNGDEFAAERIEEFAEVNSMYHAWSYIREVVATSSARVGLAGVVLPIWTPPQHFPPKGEFTVLRFTPTVDSTPELPSKPPRGPRGKAEKSRRAV